MARGPLLLASIAAALSGIVDLTFAVMAALPLWWALLLGNLGFLAATAGGFGLLVALHDCGQMSLGPSPDQKPETHRVRRERERRDSRLPRHGEQLVGQLLFDDDGEDLHVASGRSTTSSHTWSICSSLSPESRAAT